MKTPTNCPLVSVVIPVHNGEATIARCLDKLLDQSYPDDRIEIIVVNNNSTDRTGNIIKKYNVLAINEIKPGAGAARNAGIKLAKGEIVFFTDADCLADRDLIRQHVLMHFHFRETNRKIKLIGGSIDGINRNIWAVCDDFATWYDKSSLLPSGETNFHPTANLSVDREVFDKDKIFFDDELRSAEDCAFCVMAIRRGYKIYFHPGAVIRHINRTTFRDFINHSIGWTISEFDLRKKGIRIHRERPAVLWVVMYFLLFIKVMCYVIANSFRAGRFNVVFYLPLISINKFFWCLYLFRAEMRYHRYIHSVRKQKSTDEKILENL